MLDWEERKVCIKRMVTSPAALLLPSAVLLSRRGLPLDASPPSSLMPDESPDHAAVDQRDLNGSFTGADGTPSVQPSRPFTRLPLGMLSFQYSLWRVVTRGSPWLGTVPPMPT